MRGAVRPGVLVSGGVGATAVVVVIAATIGGGGPAPTGAANVWVDTNGGTCTRQAVPASYVDAAACSSFDAAWDAMAAGDTARVVAGTYAAQTINGDKASETAIIAETGTNTGTLGLSANNLTVENVTVTSGGMSSSSTNVTARNVSLHDLEPDVFLGGTNFTWDGGEFGFSGWNPVDRDFCGPSSEPIVINGATNSTFSGVTFWGNDAVANASCNHLEYIRVDEGGNGLTIKNSWFEPGDGSNTSTIFITRPTAGGTYSNVLLSNNFFGSNAASSGAFSVHGNVSTCTGFTFAYNTYVAYPGAWGGANGCTTATSWLWVGNLGPYASSSPCTGTHTRNRWQYSVAGSCGTDQWTIGPAFASAALGFDATTGALNAGSVAIDSGESISGSPYCLGALGSRDRLGGTRPVGSFCDAGQDER